MMKSKNTIFLALCLLYFFTCIRIVVLEKMPLFDIISNTTLQRQIMNIPLDTTDNKTVVLQSFQNIVKKYLLMVNKKVGEQQDNPANEKIVFLPDMNFNDLYINTNNDTIVTFKNVKYENFDNFKKALTVVETKSSDTLDKQTLKIDCTLKTDVMTLSGSVFVFNINHTFILNLTTPTFKLTEIISKLNNNEVNVEQQMETFTFDILNLDVRPLNIYSVLFRKNEIKNRVLLRLADTWLMPITDSLKTLMKPKILQYRSLLEENVEKILIENVCDFIKNSSKKFLYLPSGSIDTYNTNFKYIQSVSIRDIREFEKCDGNVVFVKSKSYSTNNYMLKHNITLVMKYPAVTISSDLLRFSVNYLSTTISFRHYDYENSEIDYRSCVIPLQTVQINMAFDSDIGSILIGEISDIAISVETDKTISDSCSEAVIDEFKGNVISYIRSLKKNF